MNRKEYHANWRKKNQYKVNQTGAVTEWILKGVNEPRCKLKKIYDYKFTLSNCEKCRGFFKSFRDKQLHHDHNTGKYIGIYCQWCNVREKEKRFRSKIGHSHIYEIIKHNRLYYRIELTKNKKNILHLLTKIYTI